MVCLRWILFGRPFDRDWLTMQPLFCYIFKRSSACDWLFFLTTLQPLSPPWKRAKCSPRQSKNSKIFPGEHAPGPPTNLYLHCPNAPPPPLPNKKSWQRAWSQFLKIEVFPVAIIPSFSVLWRYWSFRRSLCYLRKYRSSFLLHTIYHVYKSFDPAWCNPSLFLCMIVIVAQLRYSKHTKNFEHFPKIFLTFSWFPLSIFYLGTSQYLSLGVGRKNL